MCTEGLGAPGPCRQGQEAGKVSAPGGHLAAGKGSDHAPVPQQLPATAVHAHCQASKSPRAPPGSNNTGKAGKPSSRAPALQPCPLLAQGDFFFFQAAALVAQAHLTSGLWHPCQGTRPGRALRGILGSCSLLAPPLPAAPTAAGVGWGQSGPLALCWDPVGSSGAGVKNQGRRGAGYHCCPTGRLTLSSL